MVVQLLAAQLLAELAEHHRAAPAERLRMALVAHHRAVRVALRLAASAAQLLGEPRREVVRPSPAADLRHHRATAEQGLEVLAACPAPEVEHDSRRAA